MAAKASGAMPAITQAGVKVEKKGGGTAKILTVVIISSFLGLLVAIALILYFNLFNIRDRYVTGWVQNVPIVGTMIIPLEDEVPLAVDRGAPRNELIAEIERLELALRESNERFDLLNDSIADLNSEVNRLRLFEEERLVLNMEREEFDRRIAEGDPANFAEFFENMNPENAEALFAEIIATQQQDRELRRFINTFSAMEDVDAAAIAEEMLARGEMRLVVRILSNLRPEQAGAILASMEPENAAAVASQMEPPY